jgi:hypothetical protein
MGKADIWDRRWFGERQPLVTLSQIRKLAVSGALCEVAVSPNDTVYCAYQQYAFPCPKPGAQLIIGTPFASTVIARRKSNGQAALEIEGERKLLRAVVWVALARPLIVVELQQDGLVPGDFWVRVYRHQDTIMPGQPLGFSPREEKCAADFEPLPPPHCWQEQPHWGVVQRFAPEPTFPEGFSFVAAASAIGAEPTVEACKGERGLGSALWAEREGRLDHGVFKRYAPINEARGAAATARFDALPAAFAIVATIATTQDDPNPTAAASQVLDEARSLGLSRLRREEKEAARCARRECPARARCGAAVRFAAAPIVRPSLRRRGGYYGDVPLCSVDSTKFCFQDSALWHADFHLNEIRAEPMLALGQFEELLPYCEMIHNLLPQAQENARDVYDLPGAMYPLVHFPLRCRGIAHTNLTWEQDMGINGLVTKPLWLHYLYAGDTALLERTTWPVLRECARFMAAYLTEEPDGRLHIVPTVSPEHWGLTPHFERNRDCLSALTLTRYLLIAAANAAEVVGEASAETAAWRAAAERLAPYPTFMTEAGPVWVDVSDAPPIEYNIPVPLSAVFWGDEVGLDSPPETLAIAKRTLDQIRVWQPHRFYLDACIRPRLGIWREGTAIGPENLLLSYQTIRLFPAVPPATEIVVENLAAQGGFRVSAVRSRDGRIEDVRIRSLLGRECRIASPWPARRLVVFDGDGRAVARMDAGGACASFPTRSGAEYRLEAE